MTYERFSDNIHVYELVPCIWCSCVLNSIVIKQDQSATGVAVVVNVKLTDRWTQTARSRIMSSNTSNSERTLDLTQYSDSLSLVASENETNKFNIYCPACTCIVLKAGVGRKLDASGQNVKVGDAVSLRDFMSRA